jgi:hypothetical protein
VSSLSCATSPLPAPLRIGSPSNVVPNIILASYYLLDASYGLLQRNMRQSKTNPRTKPAVVGIESMAAASASGLETGKAR